jgi:hypothetical protein
VENISKKNCENAITRAEGTSVYEKPCINLAPLSLEALTK